MILRLLCKFKRNCMPDVHTIAAWASPGVQVERLSFLISVQYQIQISVTEDYASSHKSVWFFASDPLKAGKQVR